jgi:hypothetical protein
MADFATPEWIEQMARAAEAARVDPTLSFTVQQQLTGAETTSWHFTIADGRARVFAGPADEPTVTLTSSAATAAAIHGGRLSPQRAFLDGDLQIGGDLNALIAHRGAFAEIADLLRPAT